MPTTVIRFVVKGPGMERIPSISDAEWQVMEVLWRQSPLAAKDVIDALAGNIAWHPRTVKTLLGRLVAKGVLGFEREGRRYLYRPIVSRERCVRRDTRSFLDRVFRGTPMSLLTYFVENEHLSDAELDRLRQALEKRRP